MCDCAGCFVNFVDVNECTANRHNCDDSSRADCTNTDGGFECVCKTGFSGDGLKNNCIREYRLASSRKSHAIMACANSARFLMEYHITEADF